MKKDTEKQKKNIVNKLKLYRKNFSILYSFFLVALCIIFGRVLWLNITSGKEFRKKILTQEQNDYRNQILSARRGDILDKNGNILATSNRVYNVILDCKSVNSNTAYIEPTIKTLKNIFGIDESLIREKLTNNDTKNSMYQILKKQVPMEKKKEYDNFIKNIDEKKLSKDDIFQRQNTKGIYLEEDYKRTYPFNNLACNVIGFSSQKDFGEIGLESYYNDMLSGVDGRIFGDLSEGSNYAQQKIIRPINGKTLVTTIDIGIQQIVEKYVDAFRKAMGGKNIAVVVEDPNNGEILAMDSGHRFDLNNPRDLSKSELDSKEKAKAVTEKEQVLALNKIWNNYCITSAFEPGSTVKPIVMASALEKGTITPRDTFYCDGFQTYGVGPQATMIKCAVYPNAHGMETLGQVIANSCNDAMMQIAEKMGEDEMIDTQELFCFGQKTGIDLPGEGTGIIHTKDTMGITELATSSFGQGFTSTMIQEINALCSVINGGNYYKPHLLKAIKDAKGGIVNQQAPCLQKQTISTNISRDIRGYMKESVDSGTSRTVKVNGYSMGGKTGTAEKLPRGNGKYLVSFIGFAPADNPKVCVYVVVDEPKTEAQDNSTYPMFIAQGIFKEVLPYLNIAPDEIRVGEQVPETELWEKFKGLLGEKDNKDNNENKDAEEKAVTNETKKENNESSSDIDSSENYNTNKKLDKNEENDEENDEDYNDNRNKATNGSEEGD